MNKTRWKQLHNFFGISSALFLTLLLITGILLNHSSWLQKGGAETIAIDPIRGERIFLGKRDGISVSEDAGKSWEEVSILYPPQEVIHIAFAPQNPKQIYLLERWGRIFSSADSGKTWGILPLPFDAQEEGIELKTLSAGAKGNMVLLTSHGWLSSTNGGKTWDQTHLDKKREPLHRLVLTLHNGYFFGPAFVWLYDFSAIALLILIVSGFLLWNMGRKV